MKIDYDLSAQKASDFIDRTIKAIAELRTGETLPEPVDRVELERLAGRGFSVIRLGGKVATETNWQTGSIKRLEYDVKRFNGFNAGVVCGPASGVIVLDGDDLTMAAAYLSERGHDLPETFTVATGRDAPAAHLYYRYPQNGKKYGNVGQGKKQSGLDVKGFGGYVVAPGSVHPDTKRQYKVLFDLPIAPAPQWLLDLACKDKAPQAPKQPVKEVRAKGNANIDLSGLPSTVDRLKANLPRIEDAIELRYHSGAELAGPCPKCGGEDRFVVWTDTQKYWCREDGNGCGWGGDSIDFFQNHLETDFKGLCKMFLETPRPETGAKPVFKFIHISDLEVKPVSWLIKDFVETDSLALLFGDPGTYKSFLAIDFGCCVASGKDFKGRKVKQGPVIYIAGEGKNGLARRFKAWTIRNRVDLKALPLFVSAMPAGLCDTEQAGFVADAVAAIATEHGEPALIIVDTVARNFGPGNENSTEDMSGFVSACDLIRAGKEITVLLVHHCGLSDKTRARGNMTLKAALDAEFRLDKDQDGIVRLVSTKMKDAPDAPPMAFRAAVVELGMIDEDGQPVTSVVLDETDFQPQERKGKEGRGKWQTVAVEVLETLHAARKQRLQDAGFDPGTARVSVEDWRIACEAKGIKDRRRWNDVSKTLIQQEAVLIENGFASCF